jgi:hypothetical protein
MGFCCGAKCLHFLSSKPTTTKDDLIINNMVENKNKSI